MAEQTGISWCKSTFNPWVGCSKVGPGCDNCYAEKLDSRTVFGGVKHWGPGVPRMRTSVADFEKSDLPKLVRSELTTQYKNAIAAEFAKPEWQATWKNAGPAASESLQKMLIDAAPLVLASMLGSASQQMMMNFQQALQNQGIIRY